MRRFVAKYVYTLTETEPLRDAFVEVEEDGTVLRVGPCEAGEEVLDGAIVPGFVNAHCHVELSYMKGLFRKGTGMAGFIDQINAWTRCGLRGWSPWPIFPTVQTLLR